MTIFEWKTSRTNGLTDMSMLQSMIMILLKTINDLNCTKSFHIFGSFPYVAWRPMKTQPHIMFIKIKNKGRYDIILGQVRFSKGQNNLSGGQKQEKINPPPLPYITMWRMRQGFEWSPSKLLEKHHNLFSTQDCVRRYFISWFQTEDNLGSEI